jgi:phospholipase/carboxylesterase
MSHGTADDDLSFAVADAFREELAAAGWAVTWYPFEGGHGIPLAVWRAFRSWLRERRRASRSAVP